MSDYLTKLRRPIRRLVGKNLVIEVTASGVRMRRKHQRQTSAIEVSWERLFSLAADEGKDLVRHFDELEGKRLMGRRGIDLVVEEEEEPSAVSSQPSAKS